jgi:hypothetical protein
LLPSITDYRFKSVVIYRLERKKIVQSQLHLTELILGILSSEGDLKSRYLKKSAFEETEYDEGLFWQRRLRMAKYLK